ncbi:MAG TPA: hypothetical protein VGI83_05425 [Gemmatimonadales bacterium]|jgi:hypothetical protein
MAPKVVVGFFLASALAGASPASGQLQERAHDGFWISFGVGGGRNYNKDLDGADLNGGGAYIRLGGTPSEQLLLGAELIGWSRNENGGTLGRGNVTFTAMFYPARHGDFFLKAGVGGSSMQISSSFGGGTVTQSQNGSGETFGAGLDLRMGGNLYLTPNVDLLFQQVSNAGTTTHNTIGLVTIGLTWH